LPESDEVLQKWREFCFSDQFWEYRRSNHRQCLTLQYLKTPRNIWANHKEISKGKVNEG